MMGLTTFGILLCCLVGVAHGQEGRNRPPIIAEGLNFIDAAENTTVGTVIYTVLGFDPENERVTFTMTGDLFAIGRESGRITVNRPLDYEQYRFVDVNITGSDGVMEGYRRVRIRIIDSNDEIPEFGQEVYQARIPENAQIGTRVVSNITVTDPDTVNSDITVICRRQAQVGEIDPCDYFRVQTASFSRNSWRGHLVLDRTLDYEQTPSFRVPLQASDGRNRRPVTAQVTVVDVQDKPPIFTGSNSATVREGIAVGTRIMTFSAIDGDQTNELGIEYELISNPGRYFALDRRTGELTTIRELDREALIGGLITIQVAAQETGKGGEFGTRTVTQGTITVSDVNDNGPQLQVIDAVVNIKEDVADRTPLPTKLIVTDKDEGVNAQFQLRLLTYNDTFEVFPAGGTRSLTANIRVKDTTKIDYERGPKTFILRVEAREGLTTERRSTVAIITVKVDDVNDNPPQFAQTSYEASVSELATAGTVVTRITATDADSGLFGVQGIRYKLIGNGADRFIVNRLTGEITVRRCATPGSGNCLDAETTPVYNLIFYARDNFAEGFTAQVPLRIRVLDENDNSPVFTLGDYESFIDEGEVRPDPPVTVLATDDDSSRNGNNAITYSIVGGNPQRVWQIGLTSGVVTATRPVDFASTPGGSGTYTLTVQAADPKFKTTGTVRIHVRDKNNFTPRFVPAAYYEESILENSPEGMSVMTVQAYDNDASNSPNGQVRYRITSGSQDKFIINPQSGVITVNRGATFDFDQQKRYEMRVVAEDQGTPSRSATATAVVLIRDANNKNPYFEPSSVRVSIYENATVNTRVTQMQAKDPDSNAVLIYSFVQPYMAWDTNGRPVNQGTYDFTDLFTIDPNTGIVRTKRLLDRDKAAQVSTTVRVRDTTGSPDQTALATLIINILEINDRPPQFRPPWTPTNRFLNISVREELPPSFTVTTIVATDPHDAVVDYRIIDNPEDFFNINPITGVVTIRRTIDYEKTQRTYFVVTAADNGRPPLTSTATVNVNVININDNTPTFTEIEYNIDLNENARPGSVVAILTATDLDLGDFGIVRYSLKDPLNRFVVDPITGVITVRDGAVLDRETTTVITLTAEAYDSPNNPNDRKTSNIPIYITLIDTNDHTPTFEQTVYETDISEKVPVQFSVVQVSATDGDSGPNAQLEYFFINGNPLRMFTISPTTGLITTGQSLEGRAGQYNLTVGVRDNGTPRLVGRALVIVNVIEANNEPPTWIWPVFDNQTIGVLENQYPGMVITTLVKAKDDGEGENGVITYGFYHNNQFVAETPNFRINPITGIITARPIYDRETRDEYVVKLVARDGGNPPFESTRYVIFKILDVDDHNPVFPTYQNCCVIPVRFSAMENMPRMQYVGQVNATDLDIGQNAETRYSFISGNVGNAFYVNATTGQIYTNRSLDHEVRAVYTLAIRARNVVNPNRVYPNPLCACAEQSVILVTVDVTNRNDFPPVFSSSLFNACVSVDAQIGKSITTIRALDPDSPTPDSVRYNLSNIVGYKPKNNMEYLGATPGLFFIGHTNGSVHSNMLMTMYDEAYFSMKVLARDLGGFTSNATLRIFVTDPAQEVLITVKETPEQVKQGRLEDIIQWVSEVTGGGIVCVNDVRFHVDGGGNVIVDWTDILLHVVHGEDLIVWESGRLTELLWPAPGAAGGALAQSLLITKIEPATAFWGGFIIDPLLAAVLLTLLLLLLLLLLLCCLCCCFKAKRRTAKSGLMIQPSGQINPLWKDKLYEDQELNMKLDTVVGGNENAGFVLGEDATARLALGGAGGGQQVTQTTRTETSHEYAMNYERTTTQGLDAVDHGGLRIEAPLEGGGQRHAAAVMLNGGGSAFGGGGSLMADSATQVELMASRASLRDEGSAGPSAIGARLHSYSLGGTQEVHSNDFYNISNTSVNRMREEEYISSWPGPQVHTGTMNGNIVHDIHVEDSNRSFHLADSPDGLYQGEILLGSYHLPEFPNHQRQETRYRQEAQQYMYEDNYH